MWSELNKIHPPANHVQDFPRNMRKFCDTSQSTALQEVHKRHEYRQRREDMLIDVRFFFIP